MESPSFLPRPGRGRMSAQRRIEFNNEVQHVVRWMREYVRRLGFAPIARSWLYAFESERIIHKGDFDWAGQWLADRRKEGLIPFQLVGRDSTRELSGWDVYDREATPREYINRTLKDALEQAELYRPTSFWKHQEYFPVIWTEKLELLKLFKPEIPQAVRRFAGKGQTDVNSRVDLLQECQMAYDNGLQPVILYCGDHDPMGVRMSDGIYDNLADIADVMDLRWLIDEMRDEERIQRFGLNADFIERNDLLWINGLETSSGGDLASAKHKHHNFPYVQNYLSDFGAKKCESNALITRPDAARYLVSETLMDWLDQDGIDQWEAENDEATDAATIHADGIKRMLAMFDTAGCLYNPAQLQAAATNGIASLPGA